VPRGRLDLGELEGRMILGRPDIFDNLLTCSVPISKLPQFVKETTKDFEDRGITACHLG